MGWIQRNHQRYIDAVQDDGDWAARHEGSLAVSEIGGCPRVPIFRLAGIKPTNPPDDFLRRLFYSGEKAEAKLEASLRDRYGDELQAQPHWEWPPFTGTPDFVTPDAIIEHKETGKKRFKYGNLPYEKHVLQTAAYGYIALQLFGIGYDVRLYYQNQADWAEFAIYQFDETIAYMGEINGDDKKGHLDTTVESEMSKLARWYPADELPPRPDHPFTHNYWCCSLYPKWKTPRAYPSCKYFDRCWRGTNYIGKKSVVIPEEYRE